MDELGDELDDAYFLLLFNLVLFLKLIDLFVHPKVLLRVYLHLLDQQQEKRVLFALVEFVIEGRPRGKSDVSFTQPFAQFGVKRTVLLLVPGFVNDLFNQD